MNSCDCDVCVALAGLKESATESADWVAKAAHKLPGPVRTVLAAQARVRRDGAAAIPSDLELVRAAAARCRGGQFDPIELH